MRRPLVKLVPKMPYVTLHYGPYESHGVIKHKPQRLHGIIGCLSAKGYEVEMVPSPHINRLTVAMRDRTIFRCDIRHLRFNVDCEDDVVCQRIIGVIEEAAERYYNDRNVAKFVSVDEGLRYLQLRKRMTVADCLTESRVNLMFEVQEQYKFDAGEEEEVRSDEDLSYEGSPMNSPERSIDSKLDSSSESTEATSSTEERDRPGGVADIKTVDADKENEKKRIASRSSVDKLGQVVELYDNRNRSDRSLEKRVLIDESSIREMSAHKDLDRKDETEEEDVSTDDL